MHTTGADERRKLLNTLQDTAKSTDCQVKIPRVVGWYNPRSELVAVQCPFCGEDHRHGNALGRRVSHCETGPRREYHIAIIIRKRTQAETRPRKWRYDVIE